MTHFAENFALLAGSSGGPIELLDDPSVCLEGGHASLQAVGGNWLQLHSRRDPLAEAAQLAAPALESGSADVVIVVGLGLGYVLDVLERDDRSRRVLALEPEPGLLGGFLSRRDWRLWLRGGRLRLLTGPDYVGAGEAWRQLDTAGEPAVLVHPVLAQARPEGVRRALEVAKRIVFDARANAQAREANAGTYLLNTLRNLPIVASASSVDALSDQFANVPAMIVAAGPSLDETLEAVETASERALVIAVDTALRPLLAHGIEPHLVVALDPTDQNAAHLANLPRGPQAYLVAEPSIAPSAFEAFAGRVFHFSVGDHEPWPWLRSQGLADAHLDVWGSVATAAFDLAIRLGCDPLIFTGLDLGYPDGRPYARGVTFEDDWAAEVARSGSLDRIWARGLASRPTSTERGVGSMMVRTAPHLVAVRDWLLDRMRAAPDHRYLNVGGSGILLGDPVQQASADLVVSSLPVLRDDLWSQLESIGLGRRSNVDRVLSGALALISSASPDKEPLERWLAFAPGITNEEVIDALKVATSVSTSRAISPYASAFRDATANLQNEITTGFIATTSGGTACSSAAGSAPLIEPVTRQALDGRDLSPADVLALRAVLADAKPRSITVLDRVGHVAPLIAPTASPAVTRWEGPWDGLERGVADCVIATITRDSEATTAMVDAAFDHLVQDGILVVVDVRISGRGSRLRRDLHRWLTRRPDAALDARRTDDRWTRLQVVRRAPARPPRRGGPQGAVSTALARRLVARYHPSRLFVIGLAAKRWIPEFQALGVNIVEVADIESPGRQPMPSARYDLCLLVDILETTDATALDRLVDHATRSSDIVAICCPPPGLTSGPDDKAAPLSTWTRRFLTHGFQITDELRAEVEEVSILEQDPREGWVRILRRLTPEQASLDRSVLAELLAARDARIEDLEIQLFLMRFERGIQGLPPARSPADPPVRLVEFVIPAPRIDHEDGLAYSFRFRSSAGRLYTYTRLFQDALLEEDGRPLSRPHAYHADVVNLGAGRTALWPPRIVFASSDDADPRTSGRRYSLLVPAHVALLEKLSDDALRRLGL